MMLIDPEELLPQHRVLLERDFQALGEGSTVDRQIWWAQVKAALGASEILGSKQRDELLQQQMSDSNDRWPVVGPFCDKAIQFSQASPALSCGDV